MDGIKRIVIEETLYWWVVRAENASGWAVAILDYPKHRKEAAIANAKDWCQEHGIETYRVVYLPEKAL